MNDWMNNPKLSGIDPQKLAMLQSLAAQGSNKPQNEMLSFLTAVSNNSQKSGMQFSSQEMSMIIEVLKTGKSPQEIAKIDQMMNIMRMMNRR